MGKSFVSPMCWLNDGIGTRRFTWFCAIFFWLFSSIGSAYRYDPALVDWNLNENQYALSATQYTGQWADHNFTASPSNWRFPFYTIMLDRFVNGIPDNDDINSTYFEHDLKSNQMRHGGDIYGLRDTLDYLQGMGIKALYLAGSSFINLPWAYDGYSPVDLTLLDQHFGTIQQWREVIEDIHSRGMYVVLDNTFATLSDLIGFEGYLNTTTPFNVDEYPVLYKSSRQYYDFEFGNTYNATCDYPRFWNETGFPVESYVTDSLKGCYDSDFDQYGDTEAFGVYPDWRRELTKFASVQDRLREWHPPVRAKIETFYCMLMSQLDVDGFRYDKATQSTVDAMGFMNAAMRQCARGLNKTNFFLPGEITGGNDFGSIFIGRGRQPDMRPNSVLDTITNQSNSDDQYSLRAPENAALDSAAFHYTVYRTLTRFLGLDGNLAAGYDAPTNWVDQWNTFLVTNDFINAETGEFDPRHMYGVTNQDVFRWPAIANGTQRQLLGHFITTLLLPGIPLLLFGEEQAFYILDNTAENYIFGRQPMSSATAWQDHGCYSIGSAQYYQWPLDAARHGCSDDSVSQDHRDPSAPVRNTLKHMYHLRETYPVLNDGFYLQQLSNMTEDVIYPGSSGVITETGMWSVVRSTLAGVQNDTLSGSQSNGTDQASTDQVWLLYSNMNASHTFNFNCNDSNSSPNTTALVAPFAGGTRLRNLLSPFDEVTLQEGTIPTGSGDSQAPGCLSSLAMTQYDFRAYIPMADWQPPPPMITKFSPGHDARIVSKVGAGGTETVDISLEFSTVMDCDSVTQSLNFSSSINFVSSPQVQAGSVTCADLSDSDVPVWPGSIASAWSWSATLENVSNGIHSLTVQRPSAASGSLTTNAVDKFIIRIGQIDNPMVFPRTANYSQSLLTRSSDGELMVNHKAAGADLWRYSTNWGTSFSYWMPYGGSVDMIPLLPWNGTKLQEWTSQHVVVEYWSQLAGSSDHVQEGDLDSQQPARRVPHMFLNGPFNQYGFDAGLPNTFKLSAPGTWEHYFSTEWPAIAQVNIWGMNPDGQPDQTRVYGDIDGDSVLDRLPPSQLSPAVVNITQPPPRPYVAWRLQVEDSTFRYQLVPAGHMSWQLAVYILLWIVPIIGGVLATWLFIQSFYGVKFEKFGLVQRASKLSALARRIRSPRIRLEDQEKVAEPEPETDEGAFPVFVQARPPSAQLTGRSSRFMSAYHSGAQTPAPQQIALPAARRTVLIATMEYDIEDWEIKVKIGGLGVMAQLMGKNLGHQDLVWVVPCVGGIDYPVDSPAEAMTVKILGKSHKVDVQYHVLRNITYVLLDAPVFRERSKAEPYPARFDDLDSAIYYSAWNQCIAQAIERFPVDLYHINDYHGTVAPLYLFPRTIPVCLSLHNAEFQGAWPMRSHQECEEISGVFNLPLIFIQQFVQFGAVFNLLHAGASYLRYYQQGFGAVGVSKKYGVRSYLRYPIFWGLKKVGQLPNPDPSDTGDWDKKLPKDEDITIDPDFEAARPALKAEAQEWAGLDLNPQATLFVFVGRWSVQKGIDLIADIFPAVLESHKDVQLICVGPVIDLHGKFAALKLDRMMKLYAGRVFSKPVFTALPPCIFSGADFALIPSRDEPFGLVAVEFGRKGALGVGARVGGLGQMPGWWYTVESMQSAHLLSQFKMAINDALDSKESTRAKMRARSAKQRFPVAQWKEDLGILQDTAIKLHRKKLYDALEIEDAKPFRKPRKRLVRRVTPKSGFASPRSPLPRDPQSHPHTSRNNSIASDAGGDEPQLMDWQLEMAEQDDEDATIDDDYTGTVTADESYTGTAEDTDNAPSEDEEEADEIRAMPTDFRYLQPQGRQISEHSSLRSKRPSTANSSQDDFAIRLQAEPDELELQELTPNEGRSSFTPTTRSIFSLDDRSSASYSSQQNLLQVPGSSNLLSGERVVGSRKNYKLQKTDPFFTDPSGRYTKAFELQLEGLKGSNSQSKLCIEEYLMKSEKTFFKDYRNAKLGFRDSALSLGERSTTKKDNIVVEAAAIEEQPEERDPEADPNDLSIAIPPTIGPTSAEEKYLQDPWSLGEDYRPPTGVRKWMQIRIGDWPVYAFFLAFGQIIAANSYQIVLLTGQVGQAANEVYIISAIYIVASMAWWLMFRRIGSRTCLSLPFFFYGLAFLLVGLARYAPTGVPRSYLNHVASGAYAVGSASGTFMFVLNFGDEGGSQVRAWVFRACVIQGTQQIYVSVLWFWGFHVNRTSTSGNPNPNRTFANTPGMTAITMPIAIGLWALGLLLWNGLPIYYRQVPDTVPDFYKSLWRRKIIIWFFASVLVQNFFLSTQYGRSWSFLFTTNHLEWWQIYLLVILFFVFIWGASMWGFMHLTKSHTWILPIFALGLGAPRWAQEWWGTSGMGNYLAFAPGGYIGSALISRAIWLWLGVLDMIQGVGIGMILLSTLTRVHVLFTLGVAQVLGAATTAVARACAPHKLGPTPVFPDITYGGGGLANAWFWIGLLLNLGVSIGYLKFFRKEQLTKP